MTPTQKQAWEMVRKAKADLRKETDPDRKYAIAVWGQEMQELALGLSEKQGVYIRCNKCGIEQPEDHFSIVKSMTYYKKINGEQRTYFSVTRRKRCNSCTWPVKTKSRKSKMRP